MGWLDLLFKMTPIVVDLTHIAERFFSDEPKSGVDKKKFVVQAANDIMKGGMALSTGGASGTWDKLDKIVPSLVDTVAGAIYPPNK